MCIQAAGPPVSNEIDANNTSKTVTIKLLDEIPIGLNKNDFLKELESKTEKETNIIINKEI